MGLTDWIPGAGSTGGRSEDDVDTYYLADETPWNTELGAYRLMIGPATAGSDEWAVHRCTEADTEIPPQTELLVFQEGRVVRAGESPFRLQLAQLVLGDRVDKESLDGYFVEFPAELAGESIPQGGPVGDDELRRYLRSVPGDF